MNQPNGQWPTPIMPHPSRSAVRPNEHLSAAPTTVPVQQASSPTVASLPQTPMPSAQISASPLLPLGARRTPVMASLQADSYLAYLTRNDGLCTELRQHLSGEFARHAIIRYVEDLPREELALRGSWLTELPALVRLSDRSALMGRHAVTAAAQLAHWFTVAEAAATAAIISRDEAAVGPLPDSSGLLLGPLVASVGSNSSPPAAPVQATPVAGPRSSQPGGSMFYTLPSYLGMPASDVEVGAASSRAHVNTGGLTDHTQHTSTVIDNTEVDDWGSAWTRSTSLPDLARRVPMNRGRPDRPRLSLLPPRLPNTNEITSGQQPSGVDPTQNGGNSKEEEDDDDFGLPYRTSRRHQTPMHGTKDNDVGADDGWGNAFM